MEFFEVHYIKITYAICSTFICPSEMTMICDFMIFFVIQIFIFKFFCTYITDFCIFISLLLIFCYWFHIFLKKWIIFIASSLKDSQIYLRQSLPLYTLCLFSVLVIDDIVDIKKPDGMCSTAFLKNNFKDSFFRFFQDSHLPIFYKKHSSSS